GGHAPRGKQPFQKLLPGPGSRRHCQKGRFPSLRNHYGPAARAWASSCVSTTNVRGYKKILPCLQNFLVPCVGKTTPRSQARGNVERGSRIEAASSVSGASVTLDTTSAVGTPHRSATLPHSSEPATIAPKNTIWCTAMPRARMKLGRIIW